MSHTVRRRSDVKSKRTRALSKLLFGGARYRLEVGAAVAASSDGIVSTPGLAKDLKLVPQSVSQELRLLERAGLVTRAEDMGDRRVFFARVESTYWAFCQEAEAEAETMLRRGVPW